MDIEWHSPIKVTYKNWKGEVAKRNIVPKSLYWGATPFHPVPQWVLRAYDEDKKEYRDFALKDMWK